MAIEVQCSGCGKMLQVDEQYAGQTAVCPVCHATFRVPEPAATETEPATWFMKTPEGLIYGPVGKSELDRWVSDGRVSQECQVRDGEREDWRSADKTYPVLRPDVTVARARGNPFAPSASPRAATPVSAGRDDRSSGYLAPHRGGLILALGMLAFVVACPILSFLAWTMGAGDLREMREGRMDPAGMSRTQAGMTLGMLLSVATIIGLLGLVFFTLFRLAL